MSIALPIEVSGGYRWFVYNNNGETCSRYVKDIVEAKQEYNRRKLRKERPVLWDIEKQEITLTYMQEIYGSKRYTETQKDIKLMRKRYVR